MPVQPRWWVCSKFGGCPDGLTGRHIQEECDSARLPDACATGFLFYDHTVFIYLALGQTALPVSPLLAIIEMSYFPIDPLAPPFAGCQHCTGRSSPRHQGNLEL